MRLLGYRLRLLPATILVLTLSIPLQLNVISRGVDSLFVQSSAIAAESTPATASDSKKAEGKKPEAEPAEAAKTAKSKDDATPPATAVKEGAGKDGQKEGGADQADQEADKFDPTAISLSEMEMLQSLSQRREAIEAKEKTINERILFLEATEKRVSNKLDELAAMQKQIETLKGEIQTIAASYKKEEDEKVQSLVRIYETMKPKEAAVIFDQLDNTILLQVLSKMKEAKSAVIMANMNPVKARVVTALLIEHKKLPELPE